VEYLTPVSFPEHVSENYTSASSPRTSAQQSLDSSGPQSKGPTSYRSSEATDSSLLSRQISNRSTDSTFNSLLQPTLFFSEYDDRNLSPVKFPSNLTVRSISPSQRISSSITSPVMPVLEANIQHSNITASSHIIPTAAAVSTKPSAAISASLPASTLTDVNVTPSFSPYPSLRASITSPAASNHYSTVLSPGESTAVLPILSPHPVQARETFEQRTSSHYPIQESSSSSENWLRELDPLAAVAGTSEPEIPELPRSELDVDEKYVEDPKMRMLLKELYLCQEPANRDMVYLSQRLASFRQPWPENRSRSQIPDVAKAGFYYLGE